MAVTHTMAPSKTICNTAREIGVSIRPSEYCHRKFEEDGSCGCPGDNPLGQGVRLLSGVEVFSWTHHVPSVGMLPIAISRVASLAKENLQKVALGDQFEFLEFVDPNALPAEFAEL
jgi:hypothetical protein